MFYSTLSSDWKLSTVCDFTLDTYILLNIPIVMYSVFDV